MTDEERWMDIEGFDHRYEVSSHGRVRSYSRAKTNKGEPRLLMWHFWRGYPFAALTKNGKQVSCYVHRLVLTAFVGPCPENHEAAHLDGVRSNSHISNLEWCTRKVNHSHKILHGTAQRGERCGQHKLTRAQAEEVIKRSNVGDGPLEIAQALGVSVGAVGRIARGRNWRWLFDELGIKPRPRFAWRSPKEMASRGKT